MKRRLLVLLFAIWVITFVQFKMPAEAAAPTESLAQLRRNLSLAIGIPVRILSTGEISKTECISRELEYLNAQVSYMNSEQRSRLRATFSRFASLDFHPLTDTQLTKGSAEALYLLKTMCPDHCPIQESASKILIDDLIHEGRPPASTVSLNGSRLEFHPEAQLTQASFLRHETFNATVYERITGISDPLFQRAKNAGIISHIRRPARITLNQRHCDVISFSDFQLGFPNK